MAGIPRVSATEAHALCSERGYTLVDVRSVPEFEAGHPSGAFNVPLIHRGPAGMVANGDFIGVMQRHFSKESRLILTCRSGNRSMQAAMLLAQVGYVDLVDLRPGWIGASDPFGRVLEAGWPDAGLPVEVGDGGSERSWAALSKK